MHRSFQRIRPLRAFVVVLSLVAVATAGVSWQLADAPLSRAESQRAYPFVLLTDYDPAQAYYPDKRWQKAARPEVIGWSQAGLARARAYSESLDTSAVVIVENGVVVDAWGSFTKRFRSHSMRKSFLSILFGPAVADGRIPLSATLEELGIDDVPPLTAAERKAKVSDLLTSRSGVYHKANFETKGMRRKRPPRGSHPPGSFWYYNNWDFNALGTIYERQTAEGIFDAFRQLVVVPLRLEHLRSKDTKYHKGKYSIHRAYPFRMSALDVARLGLLYLRGGVWKGRQIIPAAWVEESTRAFADTGRDKRQSLFSAGYGYMWWVGREGYAAKGKNGQRLYVMPARNLVVVHLVDTRDKIRKVGGKQLRALLGKVFDAKDTLSPGAARRRGSALGLAGGKLENTTAPIAAGARLAAKSP